MTFELAVQIVLMHEGGSNVSDHPNDPGKLTKYGISAKAFPKEDIANLTLQRAKALYKQYYWDMCRCDQLPAWLRLIVFDCAVNQGVPRATVFIQKILKVPQDGILGPRTIHALTVVSPKEFLQDYTLRRMDSYLGNPQWEYFGKGWTRRLFEISLRAMKDAPSEEVPRNLN